MRKYSKLSLCWGVMFGLFWLASCTSPGQTQSTIGALQTLATVAAANNTTAAKLASAGAQFCGKLASPNGVLATTSIVMLAAVANVPINVQALGPDVVAGLCPKGTVPGALPDGVNPASVAVVAPAAS